MPKLTVPAEETHTNLQPLSISGVASQINSGSKIGEVQANQGASAIASADQIGNKEENFGNYIADQGLQYAQAGIKSMTSAIYNIVQSNAAQDYNQKSNAQIAKSIAPTRDSLANYQKALKFKQPGGLAKDLDSIAQNVSSSYREALQDPESQNKFDQSIANLNSNRKVQANIAERSSQLDLSQKALQQALNSDIQSGLTDSPENLGYYRKQGLDRIQEGLSVGSISVDQAQSMSDQLRKGLYFGALTVQNQTNPNAVAQLLASKKPEDLNLNDLEYNQLLKQNQFALHDQNVLQNNQYKAQNEIANAQSKFAYGSIDDAIQSGKATTAQIVDAYDKGQITFPQYAQLAESYNKAQSNTDATWNIRANISSAMSNSQVLSDFTPKQIDDHYQNVIRGLSQDGSTNVPIQQKLDIVRHYQGPVDSFANELKYDVESGNPDKIKDAVFAYNKVQTDSPLVLSDIKDPKFIAYISALSNAYKYTTSMDKDNIQKIKDSIYNADGRTVRARENDFSKSDKFSDENIRSTIANMYDSGNPWYRGEDSVNNDMVSMLKPLFRDAYRQTGNEKDAITMVANQTKALIGHSDVNDTPRFGLDAGSIMAVPPDKFYQGKVTSKEIRNAVNQEIAPLLPQGVSPDQVFLGSDDRTIQEARTGQNPSYFLYYKDTEGKEVLLAKRWQLDNNSMQLVNNSRDAAVQAKVAATSKIAPSYQQPVTTSTNQSIAQNAIKANVTQHINDSLSNTKAFGSSPILNNDFIAKAGESAQIDQIVSHYPGDQTQRPVVSMALNRMLGTDKNAWRVGQSLKLVNSVLTNNTAPAAFLKFGISTTTPSIGDIAVTGNKAGLFAGTQVINGQQMVEMVSMNNNNLSSEMVPLKDIKGFRSIPTPENAYGQSASLSVKPQIPQFNPYTGDIARVPTGQERFNMYNGKTFLDTGKKPQPFILNAQGTLSNDSANNKFINQASADNPYSISNGPQENIQVNNNSISSSIPEYSKNSTLTPEFVVSELSKASSSQIDIGDGESATPGEILSKLNFGKLTVAPSIGDLVIGDGIFGKLVGNDPKDKNRIKIKLGNKVVSVLRSDINEYRKFPEGDNLKQAMRNLKLLMDKKATLKQIMANIDRGDNQ